MAEERELTYGQKYYFALKAIDEADNESPLSNVVSAMMTVPSLAAGKVDPDTAFAGVTFTYSVVYQDPEGDAPVVADVIIDGTPHGMSVQGSDPDYLSGAEYRYSTTLSAGSHNYRFSFDDGHGPLVTTQVTGLPWIVTEFVPPSMIKLDIGSGVTFAMGSPEEEVGRDSDEPMHDVTLTRSIWISETEVTQEVYLAITNSNPSYFNGPNLPVEQLTWFEAIEFCNQYSSFSGYEPAYDISVPRYEDGRLVFAVVEWDQDANGFRLPTEAEWEYACRAGSATAFSGGTLNRSDQYCEYDSLAVPVIVDLAWYCGNSDTGAGRRTHDVGGKLPNAFGLYDMHGNVWEWCWDQYGDYPPSPATDPTGPPEGDPAAQRVRRGGHWDYYARNCRSASRDPYWPNSADDSVGFRIVRTAE
jgi:formylglycine-generating enzyme required for sulfatase activity